MGMDLVSESGEEFQFGSGGWTLLLNHARVYGWQALGTSPPEGVDAAEWPGNYDSNEGQKVSVADAASLATALASSLRDPSRVATVKEIAAGVSAAVREATGGGDYEIEVDDGYWPLVENFIVFCGRGGFVIE